MRKAFYFMSVTLMFLHIPAQGQTVQAISDWMNYDKYSGADKSLAAPRPGEHRVVLMGNSITQSWADLDTAFFHENGYVDRGISGQTSAQMLLRFRRDVIDLKPTIVVILAGTDDIAENAGPISLENVMGNIVSMVQLAKANDIKVILCSVLPAYDFPWRKGLEPAEKIVKLNSMIKSYCEENHIPCVDYYSKMVDERKGLDQKYTKDGVHPNLDGYKVMDALVQTEIKRVLTKE